MNKTVSSLLGCALAALASAGAAEEGRVSVAVGADYSTGKYGGTESTEIWYFPVIGKYENGPLLLKLTVPYLRITGPGNVIARDGIVLPGGGDRTTESGIGDVVAFAGYNIYYDSDSRFGLDIGGKVKLGTADETKGLGTGENDYAVQIDPYKSFGDATLFGTLGYRWTGDPAGIELRDVVYASLGAAYKLSAETTAGVAYDFRQKTQPASDDVSEASVFLTRRFGDSFKVQVYGLAGFSDVSPDYGGGLVLTSMF